MEYLFLGITGFIVYMFVLFIKAVKNPGKAMGFDEKKKRRK